MGRSPCCVGEANLKKGPWTTEEDSKLTEYIEKHGEGRWSHLPKHAGLNRCGKSCRLRWINYLRPNITRGKFTEEEEKLIIQLHSVVGNKWSTIAARLPGRTDNEIKNYWNTHVRKKLLSMGIDPVTHRPTTNLSSLAAVPNPLLAANLGKALQLTRLRLLHRLLQLFSNSGRSPAPTMDASNLIASLDPQMVDQINVASPSVTTFMDHSSTPSLISWSPANSPAEPPLKPGPMTSPPVEPCCGINLGDLDCDLSWKDILDKLQ